MVETNQQLVVSTIKKAEDQEGYIILLYNGKYHQSVQETLTFHFDIQEAYYTDLKEQKNEEIQIKNNTLTLKPLNHCQFITIYVR